MEAEGIEPYPNQSKSTDIPHNSQSGAPKASPTLSGPIIADADLAAVNEAWPVLPMAIRAGILAMFSATKRGP
jgi:hypothetical protein